MSDPYALTPEAEHDEFVSDMLKNAPELWDGDDAPEAIAVRYVRHLEAEVTRLGGDFYPVDPEVAELHSFSDPDAMEEWAALDPSTQPYSEREADRREFGQ